MNPLATSAVAQARTVLSTRSRRRVALGLVAALAVPGALVLPAAAAVPPAPCSSPVSGARDACAQAATLAATFSAPGFIARTDAELKNSTTGGATRTWASPGGYAATDNIRYQSYVSRAYVAQAKDSAGKVPVKATSYASRQRMVSGACYYDEIQTTVTSSYDPATRRSPTKVFSVRRLFKGNPGVSACSTEASRAFVRSTATTWYTTALVGRDYTATSTTYKHGSYCSRDGLTCQYVDPGTAQLKRVGSSLRVGWVNNSRSKAGVINSSWATTSTGLKITGRVG